MVPSQATGAVVTCTVLSPVTLCVPCAPPETTLAFGSFCFRLDCVSQTTQNILPSPKFPVTLCASGAHSLPCPHPGLRLIGTSQLSPATLFVCPYLTFPFPTTMPFPLPSLTDPTLTSHLTGHCHLPPAVETFGTFVFLSARPIVLEGPLFHLLFPWFLYFPHHCHATICQAFFPATCLVWTVFLPHLPFFFLPFPFLFLLPLGWRLLHIGYLCCSLPPSHPLPFALSSHYSQVGPFLVVYGVLCVLFADMCVYSGDVEKEDRRPQTSPATPRRRSLLLLFC